MAAFDNAPEGPGQPLSLEESCQAGLRSEEKNDTLSPPDRIDQGRDILHGLNNALVSILLNAQVIEWKLPSYSRLKRNVHEVERSAQRGGLLIQRLRNWLDNGDAGVSPHAERETQYASVDSSQIGGQ